MLLLGFEPTAYTAITCVSLPLSYLLLNVMIGQKMYLELQECTSQQCWHKHSN